MVQKMTIIKHEMRQSRISLVVWTAAIALLFVACILIYPEMKGEMDGMNDMFASMGSFTEAFGMDQVNFGSLIGFYAVECGNILGLGGAFFAALSAVSMLAKEEKEHTAEFLFTHPLSRRRVVTEKLIAVFLQIVLLNLVVFGISIAGIAVIGEDIPWKEVLLLHLAYFLLQLELAGICFGISAFLRRGSLGIGLGFAAVMYFLNIIANISDRAGFLKHITPFAYAEGTDIVMNLKLDTGLILTGMVFLVIGVLAGYVQYNRKDIV